MDVQSLTEQTSALWNMAHDHGPRVLGALMVLVVGGILAHVSSRFVGRALERTGVDVTLRPVITNTSHYAIIGLTLVIVLQQFGVQAASLLALIGTIGLAVGLALQGTLSNVAAGLMLLFLRPYEVGEVIETGDCIGTVLGLGLFHTNLRTTEGVDIIVPNSNILSASLRNMSRFPERVLTVHLTVAPGVDLNRVMALLREKLEAQPLVVKDQTREVHVKAITGGGTEITANAWVRNEDYHEARTQYLIAVRAALADAGINLT